MSVTITIHSERPDEASALVEALTHWLETANAQWRWHDATSLIVDNPHALDTVVSYTRIEDLKDELERLIKTFEY